MATTSTGTTGATTSSAAALGSTGGTSSSGLAEWASPYITNYLGKAQALAAEPYQTYAGPLTAGESQLQTDAFKGIGALTVPSALTDAAKTAGNLTGAPTPYTSVGGQFTDTGVAQSYMNPYLQQALNPQLAELQRQARIRQMQDTAKFVGAGAFGGSRQGIVESEGQRNLLNQLAKTTGEGYATAYDKAMQQYNEDQKRKIQEAQFGATYGLDALGKQIQATELQGRLGTAENEAARANLQQMLTAGAAQRGIEAEGIAADLAEFNAQREFPYKQVQFMRDMISGLPVGSITNTPSQLSGIAQLIGALGGADQALKYTGMGSLADLLKKLGLNLGEETGSGMTKPYVDEDETR